jgi:hypothetical protein
LKKKTWLGIGVFGMVLLCGKAMSAPPKPAATPTPLQTVTYTPRPAYTNTYTQPPASTRVAPSPLPTALVLPIGRRMAPGKWCTTYAKTFSSLARQSEQVEVLRRPRSKNGVKLDNSKRWTQADALYAKITAYDPGQAIADAIASLPYKTHEQAALAAPDGANENEVNVDMWYAYDDVGRAEMRYTQKWNSTLLAPDDKADAHDMGRTALTNAIGTPPTSKPGSGETGLCYVQKPYATSGGGSVSSGSSGGGCSYHGRPRATWKVWRWGDWSC